MFEQIKAIVDLTKQVPEAVGYDTVGPITFPIPDEIRAAIPSSVAEQLKNITVLNVRIDNFSNKTQRNLRVLFSGHWSFTPQISFYRRDVKPRYELRTEDKELVILEIPPNESISIDLFNPSGQFKIEQIMVGDVAITHLMQRRAEFRRYPSLAKMQVAASMSLVVAVLMFIVVGYFAWGKMSEQRIIESATTGLESCAPRVYDNKPGNEAIIERKFQQAGPIFRHIILSLNKVDTLSDLKLKDQVILCEAAKP